MGIPRARWERETKPQLGLLQLKEDPKHSRRGTAQGPAGSAQAQDAFSPPPSPQSPRGSLARPTLRQRDESALAAPRTSPAHSMRQEAGDEDGADEGVGCVSRPSTYHPREQRGQRGRSGRAPPSPCVWVPRLGQPGPGLRERTTSPPGSFDTKVNI